MIAGKVAKSFHNDRTRALKWPYGAETSALFDNPSPVFTGISERIFPESRLLKAEHVRAAILYLLLREAAWQAINTNSFPCVWNDLSSESKEAWHTFTKSVFQTRNHSGTYAWEAKS